MEITEVQVKLIQDGDDRLKASCTIAIDGEFVIRDVKVIEGTNGLFVAMPSRKLTDHCPKCRSRNHLRARFCNNCGAKLNENRGARRGGAGGGGGGAKQTQMHTEIAHPINSSCRERLHNSVIEAYERELAQSGGNGEAHPRDEYRDDQGDERPNGRHDEHRHEHDDASHESEYDDLLSELKSDAKRRRAADDSSAGYGGGVESTADEDVDYGPDFESSSDDHEDEEEERREASAPPAGPADDFGAGL